jgi:hypothetical protein
MKKNFDGHILRTYWERLMHSVHNKLNRGAEAITRMMHWARGNEWRRKEHKKKSSDKI